jgi:ferredoxin-NADP reductase
MKQPNMTPLKMIDDFLNYITIYRLVLYGLAIVAAGAVFFGFDGQVPYTGWALLGSLALLMLICWAVNKILARVWVAQTNTESSLITALILFFIMPPPTTVLRVGALVVAAIVAMASKYILATKRKHIFNPAALAAFVVGVTGLTHATWWVASPALLPLTLLLGLLVLRKIRRFQLFGIFAFVGLLMLASIGAIHGESMGVIVRQAITSWPLLFLGTIMLTEPSTLPPQRWQQMVYGGLVGVIFASQIKVGSISSTPEVALLIGNLYAYTVGQRSQLQLRFMHKTKLSGNMYDFSFVPERKAVFKAGQYAEWTLPHKHVDQRGNRRTFTIASSPISDEVHIGIKVAKQSSSFKRALLAMQPGDVITTGQFTGSFTLPIDPAKKIVFIAGGIGITPFLSMLGFLADINAERDVVLVHLVRSPEDIGYDDALRRFTDHGIRVVSIAGQPTTGYKGLVGDLDESVLKQEVPDYKDRAFYLSGPHGMVDRYQNLLREAGVKRNNLVTDHFSGY